MFRILNLIVFALSLISAFLGCGGGGSDSSQTTGGSNNPKAVQVLFVGDSLTYVNDLPGTFRQLAETGGHSINAPMVGTGGETLTEHSLSQAELDKIRSQHWHYVVLQEQSQVPIFASLNYTDSDTGKKFADEMYTAAHQLDAVIHGQGAQTIFFVAWGRDESRAQSMISQHPMSSSQMQQYINAAYKNVADSLGGRTIAPVGSAWQTARIRGVPDNALWDVNDGYHPAIAGTYLAACVFYATIFKESPIGLSYTGGLSQNDASILQAAAWDQYKAQSSGE